MQIDFLMEEMKPVVTGNYQSANRSKSELISVHGFSGLPRFWLQRLKSINSQSSVQHEWIAFGCGVNQGTALSISTEKRISNRGNSIQLKPFGILLMWKSENNILQQIKFENFLFYCSKKPG